jgi:ABC-type multidrug transport system permease subunit
MPVMARDDKVPFCQCLGSIIKRDFLNTARNPMVVRARIVMTIILGLFTGGVYWKISKDYVSPNPSVRTPDFMTVAGLLFYMSMSSFMGSLSPVSIVFPKERLVFLKEEGARLYTTWMFYLSRTIVELPFLILIPLLYALIVYWMIGLANTAGQFFMFYLISFLVSFAGNSMGLLLGCAISDAKLISVLTPVFILPFVLFSGFYKNRADLPIWLFWIEYLSPIKYSFISFVRNEFSYYGANSPVYLLSFEDELTMWASLGVLIGLSIFIRIISYILLYKGRTRLQ